MKAKDEKDSERVNDFILHPSYFILFSERT